LCSPLHKVPARVCMNAGDHMLSLAQAAKAAGKSRPTIARAIKSGRLSAARTETGAFAIDPAELARVFPLAVQSAGTMKRDVPPNGADVGMPTSPALSELERSSLEARISEQAETIRNLWQRLDAADQRVVAEVEERRRLRGCRAEDLLPARTQIMQHLRAPMPASGTDLPRQRKITA